MAKKNDKQYTITLNERQLHLLSCACGITNSLIRGQLNHSLQHCCEAAFEKLHKAEEAGEKRYRFYAMRFEVEAAMHKLRKLCWGLEYGEDNGLGYDDTADVLFDMKRVMQHALWLEKNPKKRSGVLIDAFEHTIPFGSERRNIKVTCQNGKGK